MAFGRRPRSPFERQIIFGLTIDRFGPKGPCTVREQCVAVTVNLVQILSGPWL
jgi:hypothetical protein